MKPFNLEHQSKLATIQDQLKFINKNVGRVDLTVDELNQISQMLTAITLLINLRT